MPKERSPILYKCPYCRLGRFTAEDGWAGACRHIKENHTNRGRTKKKRREVLLDSEEACYPEEDLSLSF